MRTSATKRLLAIGISGAVAFSLLCVAAWMVFSGDTRGREPDGVRIIAPAETPGPVVARTPSASTDVAHQSEETPPQQIIVYITGEVAEPGVYTIAEGERLDAVLALAGGPTENADLSRINLAAYATDAAHYTIPEAGEPVGYAETSSDGSTGKVADTTAADACQVPVNINTASVQCLETLPGIGGVRAESIVDHREQEGPFAGPEAVTDVPGIGDGIYRRIADMITVAPR